MILLLSNCFLNLQAIDNNILPSIGEQIKEDTCVSVPIKYIRNANDKLIERKYLLKITSTQNSIIDLNKQYILQQDSIIADLKNRITKTNKINEDLEKQYKKERTKKIIYGSVAGAFAATTAIAVITAVLLK